MLGAVMHGWNGVQPVINLIIELAEMAAKEPWDMPEADPVIVKLAKDIKNEYRDGLRIDLCTVYADP